MNQDLMDEIFSRLCKYGEDQPKYWCSGCHKEIYLSQPFMGQNCLCLGCETVGVPLTEKPKT